MTPRSQCKDDAEYLECLRDDFAAAALTTMPHGPLVPRDVAEAAEWSYRQADAMLKERAK